MNKFKFGLYMVLLFACGMNFVVQLSLLVVINPSEPSWWKAIFSAALAVMWSVFGWDEASKHRG